MSYFTKVEVRYFTMLDLGLKLCIKNRFNLYRKGVALLT
eukprot:UN15285